MATAAGCALLAASTLIGADPAGAAVPRPVTGVVLPTAQTNNTVYAVAIANGHIFLGGDFTTARPAAKPAGVRSSVRTGFAVLSARSGALLNLTHRFLTAAGRPATIVALATSPRKGVLYVGGAFASVDGQPRHNLAAINTATGRLLPGFGVTGVNGEVLALAATGATVYVGGEFSAAGDSPRADLAAFASNGSLRPFTATPAGQGATGQPRKVLALGLSANAGMLYVGGVFDTLDGGGRHAFDAVDAATGALDPRFAAGVAIPSDSYVTTIATDATRIFIGGRADATGGDPRRFEGVQALDRRTGAPLWEDRCYGDTFALAEFAGYLYIGSHTHDCSAIGGWPESDPPHYQGLHAVSPATGRLLPFYPQFRTSSAVAGSQDLPRGLAIDGTQLVAVGGWLGVDGRSSQDVARFTGDGRGSPPKIPGVSAAIVRGHPVVTFHTVYDDDSTQLTYRVYRAGVGRPIYTRRIYSVFWNERYVRLEDRTARPGRPAQYYVTVSDGATTVRSATTGVVRP